MRKLVITGISRLLAPALLGAAALVILFSAGALASPQSAPAMDIPLLLGIYPQSYISQATIDSEIKTLDAWAGKQTSIVAISIDILQPTGMNQLTPLWDNGYTPFINLTAGVIGGAVNAYEIAAGNYDAALAAWAQSYAYTMGSAKWAFIAVLPEMNTPWVSYGMDAGNYKIAFSRIQSIFAANGVPDSSLRWVFAPNGWYNNSFTEYYPGDDRVDIVAFSSYNFGFCPAAGTSTWRSPEQVFGPYISQLHQMAPAKPVFVSTGGTSAYNASGQTSAAAKDQWLRDAYSYLASTLYVKAVIYRNIDELAYSCDWAIYKSGGTQYSGYVDAVANANIGYRSPQELAGHDWALGIQATFLPMVLSDYKPVGNELPILLGIYPQNWAGTQSTMDNEFHNLDAWAGKSMSLAGTFVDFELANYDTIVRGQLTTIWNNGYTPFVNINSHTRSAYAIANGQIDSALHAWGAALADYANGGTRMAFIAPLQEMNGDWVVYGQDPYNFKLAYWRIQQIFAQEGVPSQSVRWVFAPNGWSWPGHEFENYYPGDSTVDVVAFSAYNFGYHPSVNGNNWEDPWEVYGSYLARMAAMAPGKPIFISQTATTAYYRTGPNDTQKNEWLHEAYDYLAAYPSVQGIMYFNLVNDQGIDWPFYVYNNAAKQYQGYRDGVANPAFDYVTPSALLEWFVSFSP